MLVSPAQAQRPTSTNASYAAAKAAAEAWTLALADRFRATGATANVVVVGTIVTPAMREESPDRGLLDRHAGRGGRRGDRVPLLGRRRVDERPAAGPPRRGLTSASGDTPAMTPSDWNEVDGALERTFEFRELPRGDRRS